MRLNDVITHTQLKALALAIGFAASLGGCLLDLPDPYGNENYLCESNADCVEGYVCQQDSCVLPNSGGGDSASGDPAMGDSAPGDQAMGDSAPGDQAMGDSAAGDQAMGDSATGDSVSGDSAAGDAPPTPSIPVVTKLFPAANSNAVPYDLAEIFLEFSEPMNEANTIAAFTINPPLAGDIAMTSDGLRLTFTLAQKLEFNATHQVELSTAATSANGVALATIFEGSFGVESDTYAPTLISSLPTDGATGLDLHPVLTLTFSEPMSIASVQSAMTINGANPTGSFAAWQSNDTIMVYTPGTDEITGSGTTFTISVAGSAVDLAGNAISAFSISFTLGA